MAFELADAVLEKFGGDSLAETRRQPSTLRGRARRDRLPGRHAGRRARPWSDASSPAGSACRSSTSTPRSSSRKASPVTGDLRGRGRGRVPGDSRPPRSSRPALTTRRSSRAAAASCSSPRTASPFATPAQWSTSTCRSSCCASACGPPRTGRLIREEGDLERLLDGPRPALPGVRRPRRRRQRHAGRGRRRDRRGAALVRVTVPIAGRAYDVVIGAGVLDDAARHLPAAAGRRPAPSWWPTAGVAERWFERLSPRLVRPRDLASVLLTVPAGEDGEDPRTCTAPSCTSSRPRRRTATTWSWRSAAARSAISQDSSLRRTCGACRSCRCRRRSPRRSTPRSAGRRP